MRFTNKILVFLPVLLVSAVFINIRYFHQYLHTSPRRLMALTAAILLFYGWVITGIIRRRQHSFADMVVQASFYVYVFSVLTLTGYFILFNQVSAHHWWQTMIIRYNHREGVNLKPFVFLKGHHLFTYETIGNFIMLLPLGIYLPLLYRPARGVVVVTLIAMLVSMSIELMQLATNTRITDVDDVILNTSGAAFGCIMYYLFYTIVPKPFRSAGPAQAFL